MMKKQVSCRYKCYAFRKKRAQSVLQLYDQKKHVIHKVVRVFDVEISPLVPVLAVPFSLNFKEEVFYGVVTYETVGKTNYIQILAHGERRKIRARIYTNGRCVAETVYFQVLDEIREILLRILLLIFSHSRIKSISKYYRRIELATTVDETIVLFLEKLAQMGIIEGPYEFDNKKYFVIRGLPPPLYDVLIVVYRSETLGIGRWKLEVIRLCNDKRFGIKNPPFTQARSVISMLSALLDILTNFKSLEDILWRLLMMKLVTKYLRKMRRRMRELAKILLTQQFIPYSRKYKHEIRILRKLGLVTVENGLVMIVRSPTAIKYLLLISRGIPFVKGLPSRNTIMKKARDLVMYAVIRKILHLMRAPEGMRKLQRQFLTLMYARAITRERVNEAYSKVSNLVGEEDNLEEREINKKVTNKERTTNRGTPHPSHPSTATAIKPAKPKKPVETIYRYDEYFLRVTHCSCDETYACRSYVFPRSFGEREADAFIELTKLLHFVNGRIITPDDMVVVPAGVEAGIVAYFSAILYLLTLRKEFEHLKKYVWKEPKVMGDA